MTTVAARTETRYFHRFTLGQRYLHGIVIITFLGLALTGLPLRFSSLSWSVALARALGGFGAILFLHKLNAIILTIAFLAHVANILYRVVAKKEYGLVWGPNSLVPSFKDFKDVFQHFRWFFWLGEKPRFERYAYWDRVDYWAVFWGMAIIGFSGYAMWFAPFFARFLPGWALNAVLVIHSEEGLLAILFIFSIHFVNTHLRPDSFPMDMVIFTGVESEREFEHKRPQEYARLVKEGNLEKRLGEAPATWFVNFSKIVGFTAIFIGIMLLVLTLTAYFD